MIIIIEGPDGSGKTTLANEIRKATGYSLLHFDKPSADETPEKMFNYYKRLFTVKNSLILDRSWYSEQVYGPVMRGGCFLSEEQCSELNELAEQHNALLIHCTGEIDDVWNRCQERGENHVLDKETFTRIHRGYHKLFAHTKLRKMTYELPV